MVFVEQWKAAKKQFEDATGKKKPSPKFLGVIRQGSGLDSATKSMDAALQKGEPDALAKAEADFNKASDGYAAVLKKAAGEEKGATYKDEVAKLEKALDAILTAWIKAKGDAVKDRFDRESEGVRLKIMGGAAEAKTALGPAREDYNKAESLYTSMHQLLGAILTKQQEGNAAAVKAAADTAAKTLKEIEAIVPRLAARHQKALTDRRANKALFETFKAKFKTPPVAANYFDSVYDPFVDQIDVLRDKVAVEIVPKARQAAEDAKSATKGTLDSNKVLSDLVFALGSRVKTLHDQAYARIAAMDNFTKLLGDYDNINNEADPLKKAAKFKALDKEIDGRGYAKEAAAIKQTIVSSLGTAYGQVGPLVTQTKNVPGADASLKEIKKLLDEMEKWPDELDKSVEKILKLQARIPR